jgi:hypothetical protein
MAVVQETMPVVVAWVRDPEFTGIEVKPQVREISLILAEGH